MLYNIRHISPQDFWLLWGGSIHLLLSPSAPYPSTLTPRFAGCLGVQHQTHKLCNFQICYCVSTDMGTSTHRMLSNTQSFEALHTDHICITHPSLPSFLFGQVIQDGGFDLNELCLRTGKTCSGLPKTDLMHIPLMLMTCVRTFGKEIWVWVSMLWGGWTKTWGSQFSWLMGERVRQPQWPDQETHITKQ